MNLEQESSSMAHDRQAETIAKTEEGNNMCPISNEREREKEYVCVCAQLVLNKNIYINCGGSIIKNIMTVDAPTKQSSQTEVLVHSPK